TVPTGPGGAQPDTVPTGAAAASATGPAPDAAAASPAPPGPGLQLGDPFDSLVVQFPTAIPEGMQRPYFLMGGPDEPVYVWVWGSGEEGAREALGRGLGSLEEIDGEPALSAQARFSDGEWRLLVRRPLVGPEAQGRLQLEPGRAIPLAVFAWDGSNGESGTRGAISTWYFLYLDRPTGRGVYVWPLLATLLTAGLGVVVVARARRTRDATDSRTD
ncbi:MAG TPA: hypothetical protein VFP98_00025, partial [Candidatus Polarisedimenticolia bacterium]|nr:hypothetical protein [Candidatus Polarisedimenticolia bacterium]